LLQAQASGAKVIAGLPAAQGLRFVTGFYWNRDNETRVWSKRFFDRHGRMPTSAQAAVYSAIHHYLRAIEAAGTDEAKAVMAKMREIPVNDFYTRGGKLREDGRLLHDMYFVQVKTPAKSSGPWDYCKIIATIPGDRAVPPAGEDGCPLIKR
jgi:branched-chain amino acid transport system substrate-binding protein